MDYQVVFIATEKEPELQMVLIPLILLFAGIGMLIYFIRGRRRVQLKGPTLLIFPVAFTSFAAIMTIFTTFSYFHSKSKTSEIISNRQYEVVEGTIENFDRMPYGGHRSESFSVSGIFFEYSDYSSHAGINSFNQTVSHGGPIRSNGQRVRLSYITLSDGTNLILKVEVPND